MPVGQKWTFFCKDGMKLEDDTSGLYKMQEVLEIECLDGNTFEEPASWPECIDGKGFNGELSVEKLYYRLLTRR